MINIQQEEVLKQFRAVIFSGSDFTETFVKNFSGKYMGIDILQTINRAKSQMEPAFLPDISFDKIVKLHQSRNRISSLINNHPEYLLNEFSDNKDEKTFERLSASFEASRQDREQITAYIKYLEDRAKKQETKDTKDRLFETVREFAQWCKEFLLNPKYEPLYSVLAQQYEIVISRISSSVSNKVGINIITYRDLAEDCYDLLRESSDEQKFQRILALINLRCNGLNINIPIVNAIVLCPKCGDKEQSGAICTKCGAYIKCPGCKHIIAKDAKICGGCGIEIDKIGHWLAQIKEADGKLSTTPADYEYAERLINPVRIKWVKNENVALINNKIAELRTKTVVCEKDVDECIAKSRYFTAKRHIDEVKRAVVLPESLQVKEKSILQKIEQASSLAGMGDKQSIPFQKIDNYAQAISLAADFDEAINKLKQQDVLVGNFTCKVNEKQVQLGWDKINSRSLAVKYIIYREDITNRKTKTEITNTSAAGCTDTIESGVSYFYFVQPQYHVNGMDVSGAWSEIKSQEIIVPCEVVDCRVTAGDKKVRIEFTPNPGAADYELHRTDGTGKKEILKANLRSGSFTDTGLKNNLRYTYTLITLFKKSSGEIVRSRGLEMFATPLIPPEPVQSLDYAKTGEVVMLSWDGHGRSNDSFRILHAANPTYKPAGSTMSLVELEKSGKVVIPLTSSNTECVLLNHAVKNYFSIWSVWGDTAIAGAEIEVLNVTEVSNAKAYISSGKLYVEWDWPSNCKQVMVSYSNNSYVDPHKIIKSYPRELYDKQKAFVIQLVMDQDYFIEIATQNFEGKQEIVSSGVRVKLTNSNPMTIKYTVKASTFLRKKLTLTVENDNNKHLPELILVGSPNRIPARKEDGTAIHVIPDGTACGSFELPNRYIRKNYYARLFLSDTSIKNIKIITPDKEYLKLY